MSHSQSSEEKSQFPSKGRRGGGGFKSPIHFHCVLHAKRGGGGVQIACKIVHVIKWKTPKINVNDR